jgi:sporulation protein YlmC with PRC-barrel domain/osmotically-inducible protein OsmY
MKTHRKSTSKAWLVAAAIVFAGISPGRADQAREAATDNRAHAASAGAARNPAEIVVASDEMRRNTAEKFKRQDVRGTQGNHLGNLVDVVIDGSSGEIAFFVVSHGGFAGIGDTLRLVPYQAMSRATSHEGFTAVVTDEQWEKMPVIDESDFAAGRIDIAAGRQGRSAEARSNRTLQSREEDRGDFGRRLVLADKLRGKSVLANAREVGEIEAIVIDFDGGTAAALLDPEDEFVRAEGDFIVPLNRFEFTPDREALTTTLTAADFSRTAGGQEGVAGARTQTRSESDSAGEGRADAATARSGDEQLTPTGRASGADRSQDIDPALQSAARSVRQLWDTHPELAKLDLRVTVEEGKIVLRGQVPDADLRERARDAARPAVLGIEVDNQITVAKSAP